MSGSGLVALVAFAAYRVPLVERAQLEGTVTLVCLAQDIRPLDSKLAAANHRPSPVH